MKKQLFLIGLILISLLQSNILFSQVSHRNTVKSTGQLSVPNKTTSSQQHFPQSADDIYWSDEFEFIPAISGGSIRSMSLIGSTLYVCGTFLRAGGVANSQYIARWINNGWEALGSGLNDYANTMLVNMNDLYVAGAFTTAGGVSANHIARWDGTQWNALGSGVNGQVTAIVANASSLYVLGDFTQVGGISANRIAHWDGTTWHALGSGISANFSNTQMTIGNGHLYVYGNYTENGATTKKVIRWDGTAWHDEVNPGVSNGSILDIGINGNDIYVCGDFTEIGDISANHIARWDGTQWHPLGEGVRVDGFAQMIIYNNKVYIGGDFPGPSPFPWLWYDLVYEWNGSSWSSILQMPSSGGGPAYFSRMFISNGDFYICFNTTIPLEERSVPTVLRNYEYYYFIALDLAIAKGDTLYASGVENAGDVKEADGIAYYDGSWHDMRGPVYGNGLNGPVFALKSYRNDLHVGGNFQKAGGINFGPYACWNGNSWQSSPSSAQASVVNTISGANKLTSQIKSPSQPQATIPPPEVKAISATGLGIFCAQTFHGFEPCPPPFGFNDCPVTESLISQLNGPLGTFGYIFDFSTNFADAYALASTDSNLYVGGDFTQVTLSRAANIARCNTSDPYNFHPLGSGLNSPVYAIEAKSDNEVYVGGSFTDADGNANCDRIARWNGTGWQPLGTGLNNTVYAIAINGTDILAGGSFTDAGGNPDADYIARWDGSQWHPVGSGTNGTVHDILISGADIYIGGDFTTAGGITVNHLAKWNGSSWEAMGSGLSSSVYGLAILNDALYVGGDFTMAGGKPSNCIAKWTIPSKVMTYSGEKITLTVKGPIGIAPTIMMRDTIPTAPHSGSLPSGIMKVSHYYWTISSPSFNFKEGTVSAPISELYGIKNPSNLRWLKRSHSGDDWENIGGTISSGIFKSTVPFTTLSEFAIGSTGDDPLGIPSEEGQLPKAYSLKQNYPNPFNPRTTIRIELPKHGNVDLTVYDVLGRKIQTVINETMRPGVYDIPFDASKFASGIYFYQLRAGTFRMVKKMILIK